MNNCLVTKLKAVVENPDLPVLETMQQFTLDAIAASGNNTMTDEQKWSLNHFFYQTGAISNNILWGKIKVVLLPMICNKNLSKSIVNYKGNIVEATPNSSYWTFSENGGLSGSNSSYPATLTSKYVGSSANVSVIIATMDSQIKNGQGGWTLGNASANLNSYHMEHVTSYVGAARSAIKYMASDLIFDVAGLRALSDRNIFKFVSSVNNSVLDGVDTTLSGVKEEVIFTSETGRIQLVNGASDYGVAILSEALSETEMNTVLNAVKNLKLAFAVS